MATSAVIAIDAAHLDVAAAAAAWMGRAHHSVEMVLRDGGVILTSETRGEAELQTIWLAALANEVSFLRHQSGRAETMQGLFG